MCVITYTNWFLRFKAKVLSSLLCTSMLCTFTYIASYLTAQLQGRMQNLMWVGSFQEKVDLFDGAGVQSTPSM